MESKPGTTYRELVQVIPQKINLANVVSRPSSKPCEHCIAVLPARSNLSSRGKIPSQFERLDTFPDFPRLKASGKAGCDFCRLLRKTIRATWTTQPILESGYTVITEEDGLSERLFDTVWDRTMKVHRLEFQFTPFGTFQYGTRMTFNEDTGCERQNGGLVTGLTVEVGPAVEALADDGESICGEICKTLSFKVYDSTDLTGSTPTSRRQLPDSMTLSPRNVEMMKHWVDDCKSSHGVHCQFEDTWKPTRLLDLGTKGTDLPRLVELARDPETKAKYAALSHIWGNESGKYSPPLQCDESNLEEFKAGIGTDQINGSFRDAIAVCRALDIRYLWIDALCIIQDAPEDWAREASQVHKVFGHAELTIVAASATNPSSRFLRRNLAGIPAAKLAYSADGGEECMIISPVEQLRDGVRESDIDESLWNQRGWPMIEQSLSNRLIYFCGNRLYFECRLSLRSEEQGAEPIGRRVSPLWPRTNDPDKEMFRSFYYEAWKNSLAKLSRRKMLRASDRLVAMGNIASEMSAAVADTYLPFAGMWKRDLAKQLLWYTDGGPKTKVPGFDAPSWSWAHIDAKIGFIRGTTDCQLPKALRKTKFKSEVTHVGPENTSRPGENYLEVTGFCKALSAIKHFDDDDEFLVEMRSEYPFDLVVGRDDQEDHPILAHGSLDLANAGNIIDSGKKIFYLHLETEYHPTGLILAQDADAGNLFRRIGVATIFGGEILLDPPFDRSDFQEIVLL
ncbi:Fc.00g057180.m01.CDS01 [Cosmosporella sp. VM-42]